MKKIKIPIKNRKPENKPKANYGDEKYNNQNWKFSRVNLKADWAERKWIREFEDKTTEITKSQGGKNGEKETERRDLWNIMNCTKKAL